jgi:aspartyl-tRNA synthetase
MSQHPYRSHSCNDLRASHVGQTVRLAGWVYRHREQKHQVFVDLRDHYGVTQLVFNEDRAELLEQAKALTPESVIVVDGEVIAREKANPKLGTGEVELVVTSLTVDQPCAELPIFVQIPKGEDDRKAEELRLRWRFLDLRRERLHRNIVLRNEIIRRMRAHMDSEGFLEVQTPILTNSSPEGARDYLVPSRLHPGQFYALPQAPQVWKQILMASGFDKYYQIAACFRDEDARADRSPGEFYQLDMEMAYVTQEDVFGVIERMYNKLTNELELPTGNKTVKQYPFPRIPYWEAIDRFGSDKPDLRYGLELSDVSDVFGNTTFGLFADALGNKGHVKALRIPGGAKEGKGWVRKLEKHVKGLGYGGLPHLIMKAGGEADGSLKKPLHPDEAAEVFKRLACEPDDVVAFGCGTRLAAAKVLGDVRKYVAEERKLADRSVMAFCFIVDYPFYELDETAEGGPKIEFSHNPFSMPQGGMEALETKDPLEILAWQYDIVCNGVELSSGAIRNHKPDVMYKAFSIVGYSPEQVDREFGHMIQAFKHGAPPHGGMAPGVDRTIMLYLDEPNIREIIAFPKDQKCRDLLAGAPSAVSPQQLDELHIRIQLPEGDAEG